MYSEESISLPLKRYSTIRFIAWTALSQFIGLYHVPVHFILDLTENKIPLNYINTKHSISIIK